METFVVRALVGAETHYHVTQQNEACSLYLLGYCTDTIAAEASPGDALAVHVGNKHGLDVQHFQVASPVAGDQVCGRGFSVVVPSTAFLWTDVNPPLLVCKDMPRDKFNHLTISIRNGHTGTQLTISNTGATRSLASFRFGLTRSPRAPYPAGAHYAGLNELGRFNEY